MSKRGAARAGANPGHHVRRTCRGLDGDTDDSLAHALAQAEGARLPVAARGLHEQAAHALQHAEAEAARALCEAVRHVPRLLRDAPRLVARREVALVEREVGDGPRCAVRHERERGERAWRGRVRAGTWADVCGETWRELGQSGRQAKAAAGTVGHARGLRASRT